MQTEKKSEQDMYERILRGRFQYDCILIHPTLSHHLHRFLGPLRVEYFSE